MLTRAQRKRLELVQGNRGDRGARWGRNGVQGRYAGEPPAVPAESGIVDLRGLEPPEPLVRILDAIADDRAGRLVFLLSREPLPLYLMLRKEGWRHAVRRDERGVELTIYRGAEPS